ncbi:MAG: ribonuclease Z [Bacteroidales bacterium]|jgi:ribonuclease Z|nr:ribonuclease Z [Bacteroidales bacterium]
MNHIELNILGCGSATPTAWRYPASQILNVRGNLFMIDAGEGVQQQFRKFGLRFNRLKQIFISHLHGDHCLGLFGLLSTLSMLGRTDELIIHAHGDLEALMRPVFNYFSRDMPFPVTINPLLPWKNELIYEDKAIKIYTIPLKHSVPTCGFLFEEKRCLPHIVKEIIDFYQIPVREIASIKSGADFVTSSGETVPNHRLTTPAAKPVRYAYCSDTAYTEKIIPIIEGIDLLYHEATFLHRDYARAKETSHSSSKQAAEIARKAGVKRLLIGHYSARYSESTPLLNEARSIFPETVAAYEGLKMKIG